MASPINEVFLQLVRLGIGHTESTDTTEIKRLSGAEWVQLKDLADKQGLAALVLDGLDRVQELQVSSVKESLPLELKLEWIGEVLQEYEQRYEQYKKAIGSLAEFYNQHGFKMMVLKGYACSLDWPKPEHRPCGDIDIWQFGRQKEADEILQRLSRIGELENKIEIDRSHHHHAVFEWEGFTIENHYDFLNVHHHRSNVELEQILKKLGEDDSNSVEIQGNKVYLPSANLHALFLLRHTMSNFAAAGMILRQLLDWAFLVDKHGKDIDWEWLEDTLEKYGMKQLYDVFNAICVEDLGFKVNIFRNVQFDPALKERVLNDILSPEFSEEENGGFLSRAIYKYRRWRANAWKHELCFKESMWSAFWSGVWSHMLKPASI